MNLYYFKVQLPSRQKVPGVNVSVNGRLSPNVGPAISWRLVGGCAPPVA